ncbi:hypothetical protein CO051_07425 [Candidatus Roizmanbacteria bacterium CG_4_9_14_0_2_um_filter_39_13]|uniref:Uncharacterized protein n=2 Tax=Candidatus Roizmaniibacteriota TaxID=1752723 RepID=A0A2M8EW54_9BACT|nr:MAG: hypothetical protein COY15_02570 [Candidatus Roizmanbacteria bacterium CG_4_10_14_0_2_um_filter_39_12]PJC30100.1 MAG: hypothetical protein CO051_07425 [Candidatus Roizmanbacteria bacterium CG_4_9_14_0_2_um_filter_39_13]PJE61857.1 MAG: hypothetical protein COU87_02365 [Candidatus Roizmanbacteria bacterium CG10_big_fil_rev_8_21_14_0_10_39_12]
MSERLCDPCNSHNECVFRRFAERVSLQVFDGELTAEQAHILISNGRILARQQLCPNLNEVQPYYPGEERL